MKRGRKFGLTAANLDANDFKTTAIDLDLASGTATDSAFPTAKAVKDYVDAQIIFDTFAELTDTTVASVADNNHVQYDSGSSKWVNKTFVDFAKIAAPSDPSTEEGRLYLKEINAANNALAVKLQKASNIVEIELTSPGAECGECGSKDGAKDPNFNFKTGIITLELYCGHSYEMQMSNWRRI